MTAAAESSSHARQETASGWKEHIPGTRDYRRHLRRVTLDYAHARRLVSFELPSKYMRTVRRHANRLAVIDIWTYAILRPIRGLRLALFLGILFFGSLLLPLVDSSPNPFSIRELTFSAIGNAVVTWFVCAVASSLLVVVLVLPIVWAEEAGKRIFPPRVFSFLPVFAAALAVAGALAILMNREPLRLERFAVAAGMLCAVAAIGCAMLFNTLQRVVKLWLSRRQATIEPESVIIIHLLHASLMSGGDGWRSDPLRRSEMLKDLDLVSRTIRQVLPRTRSGGDVVADAWAAQHYAGVAEAIRSLKKLVLVPRANSTETLQARTQAAAVAIVDGAWDTLPRQDPPRATAGMFADAARFLRALVVAALPALFLFVAKTYGVELPGEIKQFAEIGAWVWVFVGLMIAIDPDFAAKITTAKSFTSLIRGKSD